MKRAGVIFLTLTGFIFAAEPPQDWDGEQYEQHSDSQTKSAKAILAKENLPQYENILDIGCGSGKITRYIAEQAPDARVKGIDKSARMICAARKHNKHPRVTYKMDDAASPKEKDAYDLVVSFACLHWMNETMQRYTFRYIAACLKNNGVLIATCSPKTPHGHPLLKAVDVFKEDSRFSFLKNIHIDRQYHPLSQEKIMEFAQKAGLEVTAIQRKDNQHVHKDSEALQQWMKGWAGGSFLLGNLSPDKKQEFLTALATLIFTRLPKVEGGRAFFWPQLILKARKRIQEKSPE